MRVDFSQTALDHGKVNVLLCPVGEQLSEEFLSWIEQSIVNCVKSVFNISKYGRAAVRVLRSAPKQNDELWGDFLYHRRLHGVIGISNCKDVGQVERVADVFSALSASYPRSLHSCLLVATEKATQMVNEAMPKDSSSWPMVTAVDVSPSEWQKGSSSKTLNVDYFLKFLEGFSDTIRGKLMEVCRERGDCRSEGVLLRAPPEMHGTTVDDTRSANRRKRCMGRLMKQQGDMLMLAGETVAAIAYYAESYDVLRGINDYLWMGGTLLSYSCALYRLKFQTEYAESIGVCINPGMDSLAVPPPQDDASRTSDELHRSPSPSSLDSRNQEAHRTSLMKRIRSPNASPNPPRRDTISRPADSSSLNPTTSPVPKQSVGAVTVVGGVSLRSIMTSENWAKRKTAVTVDGGVREALALLSKVEGATLFEAECSLLLVRLLLDMKRNFEAAALLSDTMSVDYGLDFSEKLVLLITSGKLFRAMGFERKAAFAFRLAALQRVKSPRPSLTAWKEAYMLLSNCLDGFGLTNSLPRLENGHRFGWFRLQGCILRELSFLAHRSSNGVLAVSHSLVLLHAHHETMSRRDVEELFKQLSEMTQEIRSRKQQMRLDMLPEWLLNNLPRVRSFFPVRLPQHLVPVPMAQKVATGPFIFSSLRMTEVVQDDSVVWVQGSSAEVSVELTNPLSSEIRIEKMALLTEGAAFEAVPTSISLAPNNEPYNCVLIGLPKEAGRLTLLGYVARFFDVEHTVRVSVTGGISQHIRVVPPLPFLTVRNMLDSPDSVPARALAGASVSGRSGASGRASIASPLSLVAGCTSSPLLPQRRATSIGLQARASSPCVSPFSPSSPSLDPGSLFISETVLRKVKGGGEHSVYLVELNLYPGQKSMVSLVFANRSSQPVESIKFSCEERPSPEVEGCYAVQWPQELVSSVLPIEASKSVHIPVEISLHRWHQNLIGQQNSTDPGQFTCHCQVLYTGGEGSAAGLERCCHMEFKVHVSPLLELHDIDAHPDRSRPDCFQLVFQATNFSETSVMLTCKWTGEKQESLRPLVTSVEAQSSSRVSLRVPRVHLPEEEVENKQPRKGKSVKLTDRYLAYFTKNISLEWRNSLDLTGNLHFSGRRIQLRDHFLHNLQPEPIVLDISVNNSTSISLDDLPLLTPLPIVVDVTNKSSSPTSPLLLQVVLQEALGKGYVDTELSGKCALTGLSCKALPELMPSERCSFTSEVVLYIYGAYTLYVRIVAQDSNTAVSQSSLTSVLSTSHSVTLRSTKPE